VARVVGHRLGRGCPGRASSTTVRRADGPRGQGCRRGRGAARRLGQRDGGPARVVGRRLGRGRNPGRAPSATARRDGPRGQARLRRRRRLPRLGREKVSAGRGWNHSRAEKGTTASEPSGSGGRGAARRFGRGRSPGPRPPGPRRDGPQGQECHHERGAAQRLGQGRRTRGRPDCVLLRLHAQSVRQKEIRVQRHQEGRGAKGRRPVPGGRAKHVRLLSALSQRVPPDILRTQARYRGRRPHGVHGAAPRGDCDAPGRDGPVSLPASARKGRRSDAAAGARVGLERTRGPRGARVERRRGRPGGDRARPQNLRRGALNRGALLLHGARRVRPRGARFGRDHGRATAPKFARRRGRRARRLRDSHAGPRLQRRGDGVVRAPALCRPRRPPRELDAVRGRPVDAGDAFGRVLRDWGRGLRASGGGLGLVSPRPLDPGARSLRRRRRSGRPCGRVAASGGRPRGNQPSA